MEAGNFTATQKAALVELLDDPSPTVRRALLRQLQSMGPAAVELLRPLVHGANRLLAHHAAWYLEELDCADPVADFRSFIQSLNYELESGSLLLSRTVNADVDIGACCTFLDLLAARGRELTVEPCSLRDKCRALNRVLFHEYGFRGDTENYTDPANSFIDRVLARRRGLPITLSIVYLLVAQRIGLQLEPVGVPTHFLVGCFAEDAPFFIDPFHQGTLLSAGEVFTLLRGNNVIPQISDLAPTPVREVLCRCCRNLVSHYAAAGEAGKSQLFAGFVGEFEATYARHAQS